MDRDGFKFERPLSPEKAQALKEFAECCAGFEAAMFVGVTGVTDTKASYQSGGFKGPKANSIHLSSALGVLALQIAESNVQISKAKGREVTLEQAIKAVVRVIEDEAMRSVGPTIKIQGKRNVREMPGPEGGENVPLGN